MVDKNFVDSLERASATMLVQLRQGDNIEELKSASLNLISHVLMSIAVIEALQLDVSFYKDLLKLEEQSESNMRKAVIFLMALNFFTLILLLLK